MLIACLVMVLTHTTVMIRMKLTKLHLSPISLYSASSVCIPSSVNNFRDMLPTIRLSPLGSPIIRKYTKPFKGRDSVPPPPPTERLLPVCDGHWAEWAELSY